MAAHTETEIADATKGFDALFSNDLDGAKGIFGSKKASPFHLIGLGATIFLQAALGMEAGVVEEAVKALNDAEAAARAQVKASKSVKSSTRYPPGTEWEIIHADSVVLQGLTNALSETYYGYLQSLYALNSAHSKFNKLHKTVFPRGIEGYSTPSTTPTPSRSASSEGLASTSAKPAPLVRMGLFSRLVSGATASVGEPRLDSPPEGPLEDMIVSGAAFGNGLFNLVLSLLPAKMRGLIGFLGFKADRPAALKELAVAAAISTDPHAVFAGVSHFSYTLNAFLNNSDDQLVLMTYHGLKLRMLSWQAEEAYIIKQYSGIIDRLESRYPKGTLWILNRAKILLYTNHSDEAIKILQGALAPGASSGFIQADSLLVFELAWALLSQARYSEAAETFLRMTKMNAWSHATYVTLVLGCYLSINRLDEAQKLLDRLPSYLHERRPGGGEMPTESFIKQRLSDWKAKQARRGGKERLVDVIKITPVDELATIWNNHHRMPRNVAIEQIKKLTALSPATTISSPFSIELAAPVVANKMVDLDCPEELASRTLLLGILYRTVGEYTTSRLFFEDVMNNRAQIPTSWIPATTSFEIANLDLVEAESVSDVGTSMKQEGLSTAQTPGTNGQPPPSKQVNREMWKKALDSASDRLDQVTSLAANSPAMASRIENRVSMLRDEIGCKRVELGI